ncbi:MAG: hypothetical protein IJK46_05110 [Prevotella sp.]|nr:hypothetical protein [Prevotella sp.]
MNPSPLTELNPTALTTLHSAFSFVVSSTTFSAVSVALGVPAESTRCTP